MDSPRIVKLATLSLAVCMALSVPALAGSKIERELELAPGGRLELETDSGSVEVVGTSRTGVRVVITSRRDDIESLYDMQFDESPGLVSIKVDRKAKLSSWFGWTSGSGLRFEIEVPRDVEVDIDTAGGGIVAESIGGPTRLDTSGGGITARAVRGDLVADTSGGGIEIEDVDGDVSADTSGGGIVVESVRGSVRADTSGGGIRIADVSGDIDADTSGGSIRVEGAAGRVRADTSGGPITVSFTAGNSAGGMLSTSGGGVTVYVDPSVNLDVDASSSGGSVSSDVPVTVQGRVSRNSLQGQMGAGGATLKLRSSGGGIRIKPL